VYVLQVAYTETNKAYKMFKWTEMME
jgi:hypothetical protein